MADTAQTAQKRGERARAAFKLRTVEPTEAQIQSSILKWLDLQVRAGRLAWVRRMNSGAHVVEGTKGRRFIRYGFPGCPDIMAMLPGGRFVAIECKTKRGTLTDDQRAFLATVEAHGGIAIVARSVEDVMGVVDA